MSAETNKLGVLVDKGSKTKQKIFLTTAAAVQIAITMLGIIEQNIWTKIKMFWRMKCFHTAFLV